MITNLAYLKTALECLEQGQTPMTEAKILKVMRDICEMNIQRIEADLVDAVDTKLARNYQNIQNDRLVDILKS
jgi:hypothetical protein